MRPRKMGEVSGLVELPVVELTTADCNSAFVQITTDFI